MGTWCSAEAGLPRKELLVERKTRVPRKIFPPTDEFIARHIGPCCFEVRPEVCEQTLAAGAAQNSGFVPSTNNGRWMYD